MMIPQALINALLIVLIAVGPMALVVFWLLWYKKSVRDKRKNPIGRDMLRSPGESLRAKIDEVNLDVDSYLTVTVVSPLMLYVFYLQARPTSINTFIFFISGLVVITYAAIKLKKLLTQRNNLSLGYDAELAVGQELNNMMLEGYRVFHDVQIDDTYNIDHVVVGPAGIYAIETKARSKPIKSDGKAEYEVKYDGNKLEFPERTETEPLKQAARQAKSLEAWLTSAVGDAVTVKPILAIPGWYIERTSGFGMMVITGKNPIKVLGKVNGTALDKQLIQRIAHQLDQKCRTVGAQAYQKK